MNSDSNQRNLSSFPSHSARESNLALDHAFNIPPLVRPLSAELAALHVARVRLVTGLLPKATSTWCCNKCGHLRDGYGWRIVKTGQKRKREDVKTNLIAAGVDECAESKVETTGKSTTPKKKGKGKKLSKGAQAQDRDIEGRSAVPAKAPNQLKTQCSLCGLSYKAKGSDPATLAEFPSARQAARRQTRSTSTSEANKSSSKTEAVDEKVPLSPLQATNKPQPPSLIKGSPKLKHIPLSHPDPPTEVPPPISLSASSSRSGSPGSDSSKSQKPKKKKKSGLAKLLAASAAKKEEAERGIDGPLGWGFGP